MRYLIKNAKIVTPTKTSQRKDILIERGIITEIKKGIEDPKAKVISSKNLHVSLGFMDIGTFIGEPGYEEKETIQSISSAAARGGYTHIAPFPNLAPVIDNKSSIRFLTEAFSTAQVNVIPLGAISKGIEGVDIAEMVDMNRHGAVAFTDGFRSIQDPGLLLRALEYVKTFNGLIIQHPCENSLRGSRMIHESQTSVSLGLPGIPSQAESIMLRRDLELTQYSNSKICLHNISTKEGCSILKKASKTQDKGTVYSSVAVMNLIHSVEELETFNPLLKVLPPLRSKEDRKALTKAVKTGVIDFISSNHQPVDPEHKDLEFFRSSFGSSTIDTTFSSLLSLTRGELDVNIIVEMLSYGPRKVLGLSPKKIQVGEEVDLCLFDPTLEYEVSSSNIHSKSKNNPYIGQRLSGKVIGTMLGNSTNVF